MKLNKKGFTLIELAIAVSLVSIVMIFTMTILSDLKTEQALSEGKISDLTNRTVIVNTVESKFYNYGIASIGEPVNVETNKNLHSMCDINSLPNLFVKQSPGNTDGHNRALLDDKYIIDSCIKVVFKNDEGTSYLLTASDVKDAKKYKWNYFIFAYDSPKSGVTYQAWKLESGTYADCEDQNKNNDGLIISEPDIASQKKVESNDEELTEIDDYLNFFIDINFKVNVDEKYANTKIPFDLSFPYYYFGTGYLDYLLSINEDNNSAKKESVRVEHRYCIYEYNS